jgi:hypothetical protein
MGDDVTRQQSPMIRLLVLFTKKQSFPTGIIAAGLLSACVITGCFHAPPAYLPEQWIRTPITTESLVDSPNQPRLQVIMVAGPFWYNHTALRLVCTDRPVVFWDPGGSYGARDENVVRSRDLIVCNPPDLMTYLFFLEKRTYSSVEIFEWDLNMEQAHELHDVLVQGTDKSHPAGKFNPRSAGAFCSSAVSDFLHRFATAIVTVPESYFFPNNLAKVLYTQAPRRVIVSRHRAEMIISVKPDTRLGNSK